MGVNGGEMRGRGRAAPRWVIRCSSISTHSHQSYLISPLSFGFCCVCEKVEAGSSFLFFLPSLLGIPVHSSLSTFTCQAKCWPQATGLLVHLGKII